MLLYADYLDYLIIGQPSTVDNSVRLKFDLLTFYSDTICLSVPSCVKLKETTAVLMTMDRCWESQRIKIVLDKKHNEDPFSYLNRRIGKLEQSIMGDELANHFEYSAYVSDRPEFFFKKYLPNVINKPFVIKASDTDQDFRNTVMQQVEKRTSTICSNLSIDQAIRFGAAFSTLYDDAYETSSFFQRETEIKRIKEIHHISEQELYCFKSILDKSFSYANGISSNAVSISLISNQMTGEYLCQFLKKSDPDLFKRISSLDFSQIVTLSNSDVWQSIINSLNEIICIYQQNKKRQNQLPSLNNLDIKLNTMRLLQQIFDYVKDCVADVAFGINAYNEFHTLFFSLQNAFSETMDAFFYGIRSLDKKLEALVQVILPEIENPSVLHKLQIQKEFLMDI